MILYNRHQGPQNSSPHSSISAGGMVQPGQQANMIPQNIGPYHQGHVPNQGQPMMVGNVYGQPEMVGVPPMQHVGIQQRPFEQSSYPPSFPQQQMVIYKSIMSSHNTVPSHKRPQVKDLDMLSTIAVIPVNQDQTKLVCHQERQLVQLFITN